MVNALMECIWVPSLGVLICSTEDTEERLGPRGANVQRAE